jgi:hypothetical protein
MFLITFYHKQKLRLLFLPGMEEVMVMTGLRYVASNNSYIWENSTFITFDPASVGWTSSPVLKNDSCFAFYDGKLQAFPCVNATGYFFICE